MPTIEAMSRTRRSGRPATHARTRKWLLKNVPREPASPERASPPAWCKESTPAFHSTVGMSVVSRLGDVTPPSAALALKTMARSLFEKIWAAHVVREAEGEPTLLYVDLH